MEVALAMTEKTAAQTPSPLDALEAGVEESLHPALQWIVAHIKLIVGVVAALLLVVGSLAAYKAVSKTRLEQSRAELGALVAEADPAKRAEALAAFAAQAPESLRATALLEQAASLSAAGRHDDAAAVWVQIGGADLGAVPGFGQAAELSRAGRHAEAQAVLEGMRQNLPKAYTMLLLERLAYEAEKAGDPNAAIAAWEAMLAENQGGSSAFITAKIKTLRAAQPSAS
jgi:hypothetical protein